MYSDKILFASLSKTQNPGNADKMGISLEQAMAVGDGANDLPMLSIAGLGVAYRAKPLVRQNANQAISSVGLDGVLYLLGMHDKDLNRA